LYNQSKAIEDVLEKISKNNHQEINKQLISNAQIDNQYLLESEMIQESTNSKKLKPIGIKKKDILKNSNKQSKKPPRPSDNLRFFRKLQKKLEKESFDTKSPSDSKSPFIKKSIKNDKKIFKDNKLQNFLEIEESHELRQYKLWEAQLLKKK
jgi:hypothetical protein